MKALIKREGESGKLDFREGYITDGLIFTPLFQDDEPRFYCREDNVKEIIPLKKENENEN